ncbi:MAG: hypothetical protein ACJA1R_001479, partial [Flavobacteriales bacterium]
MIVEIRNVHHRNKGAELMLRAVVDHFAGRDDVTLTANARVGTRGQREALGILPLAFVWRKRSFWVPPKQLVPTGLFGYVHPTDVDLVLDATN